MKRYLIHCLLLAAALIGAFATFPAAAQGTPFPPCWPAQIGGTGTDAKIVRNADGEAAAWKCTVKGKTEPYVAFRLYGAELVDPSSAGLTSIGSARAYWAANAKYTCESNARTQALCALAVEALK
jgi:hypothetical protein